MAARVPTPERRETESAKAYGAFADYCRMGVGRTLAALHQAYTEGSPEMVARAVSLRWLKEWSRKHAWQDRVQDYDERMRAVADEAAEREMLEGLALPAHRVRALKRLAAALLDDEAEGDAEDGGGNGRSPLAGLDLTLGSPQRLAQLRGLLDDLAKETGGRKQNLDLTTKGESLNDARRDLNGASPAEIAEAYRELAKGAT